jgi:hypothetical protein
VACTFKVHWPGILSNMGTIDNGWAGDQKFNPNKRGRMMTASELCVNKFRKSVGVFSGNLYGTARFKLDFEVERSLKHHKVLQFYR